MNPHLTNKHISAYTSPVRRKAGAIVPLEQAILFAAINLLNAGEKEFYGYQTRPASCRCCRSEDVDGIRHPLPRARAARGDGLVAELVGGSAARGRREPPRPPALRAHRHRGRTGTRRAHGSTPRQREDSPQTNPASMTPFSLRFVIGLVRAWTRVYTCGMVQTLRDARRAEVESDLWEHAHAYDCPPRPLEILRAPAARRSGRSPVGARTRRRYVGLDPARALHDRQRDRIDDDRLDTRDGPISRAPADPSAPTHHVAARAGSASPSSTAAALQPGQPAGSVTMHTLAILHIALSVAAFGPALAAPTPLDAIATIIGESIRT